MECKVSELVKRGHDQDAVLKSSCGAVDVREVAQLISDMATQLDAQLARSNVLAAENAGLKSAIETHKHGFVRCNCCGDELMCHTDDVCRALDETPATDAFLAEVRAQGVEMLAEHLSGMNISASETSVREFAAQLRKGVQP